MGITVPRTFLDSPRWWRGWAEWLAGLPALVEQQCARWRLTVDGEVSHGSNALVVPVTRGGAEFVLRLTPPGRDVVEQIGALRFWGGRGVVRLIDEDADAGVTLLERLSATTLRDVPVDEAMCVLGGLMRRLAIPAPDHVPGTGDAVAARMATMEQEWQRLDRPFGEDVLGQALAAGDRLSRSTADLAVDGDLHSEQVLRGDREPWLVVDPVLMRGDVAFDQGRVLWTRLEEMPEPGDIVHWLWGLGAGLTEDPLRCHRLVSVFRI